MSEPCSKATDIATIQQEVKAVWKRIDEQTEMAKAVYELAAEVKVMNVNLTHMNERQADIGKVVDKIELRIDKMQEEQDSTIDGVKDLLLKGDEKLTDRIRVLEEAPAKRLLGDKEMIRKQIITAIISALITLAGGVLIALYALPK